MKAIAGTLMKFLKQRKYHYMLAILTVGLVALLCTPLAATKNYHVVPYIFLFVVSILATFMRIIPVLIASTLSALVWNYFFIPPHYTFHIEKTEDILLFGMFFMIAMLNGVLTSRMKQQEEMAKDREKNVNTMLELTLEREYLAELAQKARFLDESDKLYKTLFNSISHELRIPVATIMGAAESLITLKHTAELQEELSHEIFTASVRLNRVIENLLNMSRLESGRISLRADWHDINDLINKVSADLDEELKNFVLVVEIPDDMPLVRIDFGLMEQVLYNLLFNSAEYSPAGSEITIRISHANNMLAIKVLDRGPGFPADKISSVFNKFFRVENSKSGGLGLGLSIVKGFVEAHKGTITVENRKEGGADFTINIPSEQPEIAELIN